MISAASVYLQYGDRVLFDRVNLAIKPGEKIGLVGRNGAGKSTFVKIIVGELNPMEGNVTIPNEARVAYLHQDLDPPKERTVRELAESAFDDLRAMEEKLGKIEEQLNTRTDYESDAYAKLIENMSGLHERIHIMGGDQQDAQIEQVLRGLGFGPKEFGRKLGTFSGGWQMRAELAKMLLGKPDYLFLDEPTNHLDIESIIWLEKWLMQYEGAVITISHDRTFLDNVTKRTVEIEGAKLYDYAFSFSNYELERAERREILEASAKNQAKMIAERERTIKRFAAKATKTKMAQSMQKKLDRVDRIELDNLDTSAMKLRFPEPPRSGDIALAGTNLAKSYGEKEVFKNVDFQLRRGERVAFVGQNGQGKTTLAKILIGELEATGGEVTPGYNVELGYYAQDQSDNLDGNITLLETLENSSPPEMRTQLRNILGMMMFSGPDHDKKVKVLSGGERARLAMACLLLQPSNVLVLDEPTNHLDMRSKDVLKDAVKGYKGALIVVSHDRDFLEGLTENVIEFREGKVQTHIGDIEVYLKKRAMEDMRAVELQPKGQAASAKTSTAKETSSAPAAAAKPTVSQDELKKLNRAVQNAERKIDKLEKESAKLESLLADADCYQKPEAQKTVKQHAQVQKDLEATMEAWEVAQAALDAVS
ncbi:MAG: ABC-F family ATP-binding cassette domain-containing protein [Saprospiraceae bacterium]